MATWSVVADIDSEMEKVVDPDANYGSIVTISTNLQFIGGNKAFLSRGIFNFDLSGFPGDVADITSAKLTVDVVTILGGGGDLMDWKRCTRPADWVESEVTWNDYKSGFAWTASGGDTTNTDAVQITVPASTGLFDITGLKNLAVDAINNRSNILSIISRMNDEADAGDSRGGVIRSRENTGGPKPTLVITYDPPVTRKIDLSQTSQPVFPLKEVVGY